MDTPLGGALVALLLGLLLGLERERSEGSGAELFAGIRTFPLISLCGYLGAAAGQHGVPFAFPAVLLALGALVGASYLQPGREPGPSDPRQAAMYSAYPLANCAAAR